MNGTSEAARAQGRAAAHNGASPQGDIHVLTDVFYGPGNAGIRRRHTDRETPGGRPGGELLFFFFEDMWETSTNPMPLIFEDFGITPLNNVGITSRNHSAQSSKIF